MLNWIKNNKFEFFVYVLYALAIIVPIILFCTGIISFDSNNTTDSNSIMTNVRTVMFLAK